MKTIDPIKVRENIAHLERTQKAQAEAVLAGQALLFFETHALGPSPDHAPKQDILGLEPRLLYAGSMTGSEIALSYLEKAALEFRDQILQRAVDMAQEQFELREPCRKCKRLVPSPCHTAGGFHGEGPWDGACAGYFRGDGA